MNLCEVPRDGDPEAGGRDSGVLPGRLAAVDRQLRAHVRLHIRLPHILRDHAVCHVWCV